MRYREYRRKCEQKRKQKLTRLEKHNHRAAERVLVDEHGRHIGVWKEEDKEYTYIRRKRRKRLSKGLKKMYARKLRNGRRKMEDFKGGEYKRKSGDFAYDYE